MADHGEEDTSGLGDIGKFVSAMGSRYRRVPELKRLGRLLGKWFLGSVVVVLVCLTGETMGVGLRKAAEIYWRWWIWPPFFIALTPIAFTFFIAVVQLACHAVILPFALIGALIGYDRSAPSKWVGNGLVYLGFAFFIAWAAHDSAKKEVEPKPDANAQAAVNAPQAAPAPLPAAAPSTSGSRLNWWTIVVGVLSFCGGVAKNTFSSVTTKWAERVFDDRKRVVLYGPDDRPK